jgi:hypothetical protein
MTEFFRNDTAFRMFRHIGVDLARGFGRPSLPEPLAGVGNLPGFAVASGRWAEHHLDPGAARSPGGRTRANIVPANVIRW